MQHSPEPSESNRNADPQQPAPLSPPQLPVENDEDEKLDAAEFWRRLGL